MWFLQVLTKAALVFDKILQSLNWQRQDSLTRSPVARTLSWELVPSRPVGPEWDLAQIGTPQRRQIGTQKSVLSDSNRNTVQNPTNALSANHRTLDGCDAMATLLFSCKLQRSLLSVTSPAKRPTPDKPLAMEAYKGWRPVPPKCRTRNSKTGWRRRKQRDSRMLSGWSKALQLEPRDTRTSVLHWDCEGCQERFHGCPRFSFLDTFQQKLPAPPVFMDCFWPARCRARHFASFCAACAQAEKTATCIRPAVQPWG